MNNKKLKPITKGVGAFIGRLHFEEHALYKKECQTKPIENAVGVAPLGDPHFGGNATDSPKAYSNQNSKHQTLTSNVAITLIALVITIIVMLILVGVTVSIAINGGLFSTAKKAVTKTEEAKDSELRFMAMANAATHNEEWIYEVEEQKIPIPAGFAPTEIEGENSLEEGLVITDAEGNEFVWIPCTSSDYVGASFESYSDWTKYQSSYNDENWTDDQVENVGKASLQNLEERKNVGELTEQGVGFYVARYEAGVPEEATEFYANKDGDAYKLDTEKNTNKYKPVSKKGCPAWNYINQINAKTVSENMYSGMSYLIDSHAWNYICKSILQDKAKKDIINCSDWGNYFDNTTTKYENSEKIYAIHSYSDDKWTIASTYSKGFIDSSKIPKGKGKNRLELSTGASDDFKAYNIYDMAGNMWEWTTEIKETETKENKTLKYAVLRSGGFNGASNTPMFANGIHQRSEYGFSLGFRVVIYI